jgi:2-polyprenyl-6-methoxyphenol hydroxylase-like FAD-dependent oxidoreductase
MKIIVNGAGIAGPTLAYWLRKAGHEVLLVEEAPQLRRGGYVIDFGLVGYDIAEKMGLIPRLRELGYLVRELRFVDRHGRTSSSAPVDALARVTHGRYITLRRSDLAATVYGALDGTVETIFGDSVASIEEEAQGVRVGFDHAPPREADLLIGADGLHSRVRQLVFGPDAGVEVSLGYHVAAFEVDGYRPRDELVYVGYGVPGRQVWRFSMREDKTLFLLVFRDQYLSAESPANEEDCKSVLTHIFADVGWECPQMLAAMASVSGIYFDRVSQIRLDRWTKGRTALVGDAAASVSLVAGQGSLLAMAEAYVLAGELCNCCSDYGAAFARYEQQLMPWLRRKQQSAAKFASSFAPRTAFGIAFRNLVMRLMWLRFVVDFFIGHELRDQIDLPDYGFCRKCNGQAGAEAGG